MVTLAQPACPTCSEGSPRSHVRREAPCRELQGLSSRMRGFGPMHCMISPYALGFSRGLIGYKYGVSAECCGVAELPRSVSSASTLVVCASAGDGRSLCGPKRTANHTPHAVMNARGSLLRNQLPPQSRIVLAFEKPRGLYGVRFVTAISSM